MVDDGQPQLILKPVVHFSVYEFALPISLLLLGLLHQLREIMLQIVHQLPLIQLLRAQLPHVLHLNVDEPAVGIQFLVL